MPFKKAYTKAAMHTKVVILIVDFPWSAQLMEVRDNIFNIHSYRPLQLSTMNATLSDQDAILIMPTGGGKSLCFQLPALVSKGLWHW